MMLEINRKRPREYSNTWSHDHSNMFAAQKPGAATATGVESEDGDVIVLDSDPSSDPATDSFAITNDDDSMDDIDLPTAEDDNDSDIVILEERKFDIFGTTNSHAGAAQTTITTNNNSVHTVLPLRPSKKPRTKSLPQLPHSRISYHRPANLDRLSNSKIGEIKTNFVPFNDLNYTFGQPEAGVPLRRMSFAGTTTLSKSLASCSPTTTSCDDADGHHIVTPGALFANGRFRIKKLLGQGTFGKVVSAYDNQLNQVVAIKIIRAVQKYRLASKIELRVLSTIKKHDPLNQNHCIHLRECFDYRSHICIVTDLLKISLFDFLEKNAFKPFPGSHIQLLLKQLVRSVAFLHDLKLIHTDLKPENILLHDDSYVRRPYSSNARRGAANGHANTIRVLKDPLIQIIDFGSTVFEDEYHSPVVSTRHYRAPEIVLNIGWSFPCDMWSVGCILAELATGELLFRTHENLEHLAMMQKVTGKPMDAGMVNLCLRKNANNSADEGNVMHCFSEASGKLLFPQRATSKKSVNLVNSMGSIDEIISKKVGLHIDTGLSLQENYIINENTRADSLDSDDEPELDRDVLKFWYNFVDLVRRCLEYSPEKRLKLIDALEHPWFDLGIYDEGTLDK